MDGQTPIESMIDNEIKRQQLLCIKGNSTYCTIADKFDQSILSRIFIYGNSIACPLSFGIDNDHPLWTCEDSLFQLNYSSWIDIKNKVSDTIYHLPSLPEINFECNYSYYVFYRL